MTINADNYKIDIEPLAPCNFRIYVTNIAENVRFSSIIQANPAQLNADSILSNFFDKKNRNHWNIEVESELIKEPVESALIEKA